MQGTIGMEELVWSLFNLIGLWASGRLLVRTWQKRQDMLNPSEAAQTARSLMGLIGARLRIALRLARRNFRDEAAKFAWHSAGILIGIWSFTQPQRANPEVISLLAGWLLVAMSGVLAVSSVLNLRDDDWISDVLDSERRPTESAS
jgi:hypothetical protein